MNLMQKVTDICNAHPEGIDVEQLVKLCPEATFKQVSAAVRNAYNRGRINRIMRGGLGASSRINPGIYGPKLPDQKPLPCVQANNDPDYKRATRQRVPLNFRKPVSSVWELAR